MDSIDKTITYILRCHSTSTLPKLKSALLSVSQQRYPHVRAFVAIQDLSDGEVEHIASVSRDLGDGCPLDVEVRNFSFAQPGDHRGALLNKALECVKSRYVAFLDYDDVVYPNHAETLIADLEENESLGIVASFGGCTLAYYDDLGGGAISVTDRRPFSSQASVSACVVENCFPIHSYVLDMMAMPKVPRFGEDRHVFEDYIFLLDLMEHYRVSTNCAQIPLCEYRWNNDNSNTVSVNRRKSFRNREKEKVWKAAQAEIESGKSKRFFRVPYAEIATPRAALTLSKQPFIRGLFVCHVARNIRKKRGAEEAIRFLSNPKHYARSLPANERSLVLRLFF